MDDLIERLRQRDNLTKALMTENKVLQAENAKLRRLCPDVTGYANGYADAMDDGAQAPMSPDMIAAGMGIARAAIEKQRAEIKRLRAGYAEAITHIGVWFPDSREWDAEKARHRAILEEGK
jgi:UDP-N-acetyl-D-mannosaminuronic acid transferase (WecB/TagA/CpsF family)